MNPCPDTKPSYYKYNKRICVCALCREKYTVYHREYERKRRKPRVKHGTLSGYNTSNCRCIKCKRAMAEYRRENTRLHKLLGHDKRQPRKLNSKTRECVHCGKVFNVHRIPSGDWSRVKTCSKYCKSDLQSQIILRNRRKAGPEQLRIWSSKGGKASWEVTKQWGGNFAKPRVPRST